MGRVVGLAVVVAGVLMGVYRWGGFRPDVYVAAARRAAAPPVVAEAASPERFPFPAAPATPALSPRSDIPTGMGLLNTANAPPGRRVFVAGRTVGETPRALLVKCGTVVLKIGSSGHARTVDVPCGQEMDLEMP
jgi:hypothetical protein